MRGTLPVHTTSDNSDNNGNNDNSRCAVPRQEPAAGEQRMLHAPSVEWVRTNLLSNAPEHPFTDPNKTQQAGNNYQGDVNKNNGVSGVDEAHFGFTSARTTKAAAQSSTTLSGSAQNALREVFRRFNKVRLFSIFTFQSSSTQ